MAYNARRTPGVSEYIANLNAIPTAQEIQAQNDFTFHDDLSLFSNANFFDFDMGPTPELSPTVADFGIEDTGTIAQTDAVLKAAQFGDFRFDDYGSFNRPINTGSNVQTIATKPAAPNSPSATSPSSELLSPTAMHAGVKRKAEGASPSESIEESSRFAAEEDKRRRNTAASARFRVKKKQREQALEKSAKEMSDKVALLEGRINQLETENKWLKNLITEKNTSTQKEELSQAWKRYTTENGQENGQRIGSDHKDGVGTID